MMLVVASSFYYVYSGDMFDDSDIFPFLAKVEGTGSRWKHLDIIFLIFYIVVYQEINEAGIYGP